MDCRHLDEPYELFLLGALDDASADRVRVHLETGCGACLERVREAAQIVYLLSLRTKSARPHPRLKSQLLRRLRKK